ncbi:MAG: hypothetical protein ABIU54_10595 [Candidatus Eisenbacteria bacterium]
MAGSPDFIANLPDKLKEPGVQRVVGGVAVLVAVAVLGGVYLTRSKSTHTSETVTVIKSEQSAPAAGAPVQAAASGNTETLSPGSTPAKLASSQGVSAPMVTSVGPSRTQPLSQMAHLDDHLTYQYNALGRRDPFQSLIGGEFVGVDVGGDAPPDPGGIKVVGIVWGSTDQFALVEDVRGNSLVLRRGDKVQNGYVTALKRDAVVFSLTADGQTQSVVIPLIRKGDQNAR